VPHLLQDAGYFTCAMLGRKTDCNFKTKRKLFMGGDWRKRKKGQPFFAQATISGTHRTWQRDAQRPIAMEDVQIPPYYPDTPFVRRDWANGLEQMQRVDREFGALLRRLRDEGLAENTLVILVGDNGRCHIRGKQFLYDPGIHVPLIVRWPGRIDPGQVSDAMVTTLDIPATILAAAGVEPPHPLQGLSLMAPALGDRKLVFAARDKMDGTHDAMRAVRSADYKLIHNLMPERAYCQYNRYKENSYPMLALMNVYNLEGKLNPAQAAFMAPSKPEFELYDVQKDPHETRNLADDPEYAAVKENLLSELKTWRASVNDKGVTEKFRTGGWKADYPTKTLEEWKAALGRWQPYVFREPGEKIKHPFR
jgi:uncharacterized sulfatase